MFPPLGQGVFVTISMCPGFQGVRVDFTALPPLLLSLLGVPEYSPVRIPGEGVPALPTPHPHQQVTGQQGQKAETPV